MRLFHLRNPFTIAITPEQLGCKTWVALEEPLPTAGLNPRFDDPEFQETMTRLRDMVRTPGR